MASDGAPGPPPVESTGEGAAEPVTLTDADGSVTRVAPWSSWSRSQVRSAGGETALITRLEQGQLWFAAGRSHSPWRHEVHVGPAVVSTPRGRFQVSHEPDGGATIVCLAGRTRVVSGLCEPVVLGPDQTAAVASDGATLVVVDRTAAARSAPARDRSASETGRRAGDPVPGSTHTSAAASAAASASAAIPLAAGLEGGEQAADGATSGSTAVVPVDPSSGGAAPARHGDRRRLPWLAEVMAAVALIAVVAAAILVFGRGSSDSTDEAEAPVTSPVEVTPTTNPDTSAPSSTAPATTAAPTTAAPTTAAPTTPVPTTAAPVTPPPATTAPALAAAPATAEGELVSCRRAEGGVMATIAVSHRSGGPGRFAVMVGLVDASGAMFAQASTDSGVMERGATAPVDVLVPVDASLAGACELLGVAPA